MPQYNVNFACEIQPFRRIWVLFLLISSPVAYSATKGLPKRVAQPPHILVLDNCDPDYKYPPFGDVVLLINNKGEAVNRINGLNICQNVGGNRAISVSDDGRFFVVCENVADKITAYDLSTGNEMWSLPGKFCSAAIARGVTYALTSDGAIYGNGITAIDRGGNIIKQSEKANGFDIAIDLNANCLWLVGDDISKYNMDLNIVQKINPVTWCAVSVDIGPDGSVWVAEREHIDVGGSKNRLLNISPEGEVLRSIPLSDLSPMCVRVSRVDGSVWVTGIYIRIRKLLSFRQWPPTWQRAYQYIGPGTHKFSSGGKLLLKIKRGGHSIDVDLSDDSVWIADRTQILHYSSDGKKLETFGDVSGDQKWIAVVK